MTRNARNEQFLRTSFLDGANAAYVEDMQTRYDRNPGSVSDDWRHFFESLHENRARSRVDHNARPERHSPQSNGPSWGVALEELQSNGAGSDLVSALTGDYGATETRIRDRLAERAQIAGFEMSPAASLRATQDSIRALMMIRSRSAARCPITRYDRPLSPKYAPGGAGVLKCPLSKTLCERVGARGSRDHF